MSVFMIACEATLPTVPEPITTPPISNPTPPLLPPANLPTVIKPALPIPTTIQNFSLQQVPQQNDSYYLSAQQKLKQRLELQTNIKTAKNVILFIADGAGPAIMTATRIFDGQQKGMLGEENVLSFEKFPDIALTKTYNDNAQTPDSAGTATALLTGIKTKQGVIGIAKEAMNGDCNDALNWSVATLGELAEDIGMSTGIVTTTGVTHATPASFYAHSANRAWENNTNLPANTQGKCKDIAAQLIEFSNGNGVDVVFGGGRKHFMTQTQIDPEDNNVKGARTDNRDLIAEWPGSYVWNKTQFNALNATSGQVLGLFNPGHMEYEIDRINEHGSVEAADEPSLVEMTAKAIEMLSTNQKGYFLLVEGGRVDHAAHNTNAFRMLSDNATFAKAVQKAVDMVNLQETLIIVTSDHDHTLTLTGYAQRGNNILGLVKGIDSSGRPVSQATLALDNKPYTTLSFANGPHRNSVRRNLSEVQVTSIDFVADAHVHLPGETHSGNDVVTYATGTMSNLIGGVIEQNYVFHAISQALQLSKTRN